MQPLAVVDYGMGNLRSVQKALERVGQAAEVTRDPERIAAAPGVVLPGVGAFGACIGMQLLFDESEEFGPIEGLHVLPGRVVRFPADAERKVPHMGWNTLRIARRVPHLAGIADGSHVYFVHSYYPVPADPALVATAT